MSKNESYEYWSSDRKLGIIIEDLHVSKILEACKNSRSYETGGIIVGHYNENLDCAVVTDVSLSPSDSKHGPTWFYRGVNGLQNWLNRLRNRKEYYLGEWHFHPFASAVLSRTDKSQMIKIAKSKKYICPEPILLIIGGDPKHDWMMQIYVCEKGKSFIELQVISK
jgi:integrative and conjugative element protein (TIGR02256 family)